MADSVWNHNVVNGTLLFFISCFGGGLYQWTVMPAFLLYVGGDNKAVGFAEGLMGIVQMVVSFPVAWHADKYQRSTSIRFGGLLTFIRAGCFVWAVRVAEPNSRWCYSLLCFAMCLEGVSSGILFGPLMALIDDSVPAGSRSYVNTVTSFGINIANAAGPLLAAAFFAQKGNSWSIETMKTLILVGTAINQIGIIFAMFMDDSKALKEESEAVQLQDNLLDGDAQNIDEDDGVRKGGVANKKTCFGWIGPNSIPWLMFLGELVFAMGAGMTIRFFPLFFQNECHMSPSLVSMTYASMGAVMAVATVFAQWLSNKIGRLEVIIPFLMIGVGCTGLLGALKPFYTVTWIMLPLFIARNVFMNSINALEYSITADYTPKSMRARFMALSSISSFSWSGSAFIGGWLIDKYGYGPCFVITACLQACAIPVFFLIYPHVATETELTDALVARKAAEEQAANLKASLTSPNMLRMPSNASH